MTTNNFLAIFDLPKYHVRRFLPYNVQHLGVFFGPTLKSDVIYGRSLMGFAVLYMHSYILNIPS